MPNGGENALCGFLYQLLNVVGLVAGGAGSTESNNGELGALIRAARQLDVRTYSEAFDQDIVVVDESGNQPKKRCILVQVKYSYAQTRNTKMNKNKITKEVIAPLDKAASKARAEGYDPVSYVLITNRAVTYGGTARHPRVERLRPEVDLFLPDQLPPTLPRLYIAQEPTVNSLIDKLISFARLFGLTDNEIDHGIDRVMGHLLIAGGTSRELNGHVSIPHLVQAFTGSTNTCFLTSADVTSRFGGDLTKIRHLWTSDTPLIHRSILDRIVEQAKTRALVVVHGPGGCGKTASLWQWAHQTATDWEPHLPTFSGAFSDIESANRIGDDWIFQTIRSWGNWEAGTFLWNHDPDLALQRLCLANPDAEQPILHLGLDGLDEDVEPVDTRRHNVRDILKWFKAEDDRVVSTGQLPRMVLVVTCRDGIQTVQSILQDDRTGTKPRDMALAEVVIGDFSDDDIQLAAAALPEDRHTIRRRIENAVARSGAFDIVDDTEGATLPTPTVPLSAGSPEREINADVIAILKHPVAWAVFFSMDQAAQEGVLDGDGKSTFALARIVVRRSCMKAQQRNRAAFHDDEFLIVVLQRIAAQTPYDGTFKQYDWINIAEQSNLKGASAFAFYREAMSTGLIGVASVALNGIEGRGSWCWRHKMVWDALTAETNQDWSEP